MRYVTHTLKVIASIEIQWKYLLFVCSIFFGYPCYLFSQDAWLRNKGNDYDIHPILQAAVDKAEDGDTIIIPEGAFHVSKTIVITKFISLKGQGSKKTILYQSENTDDSVLQQNDRINIIRYDINKNTSSTIIVSDIGFRSKRPNVREGDGGSMARTTGIALNGCVDFTIEKCRFEYFGNRGIMVRHRDDIARGLIRKNEFYYNAGAGLGYGVEVFGSGREWVPDPKWGTSNFIFVEDNVFEFHRHSMAAGGNALYVFRYNKIINNIVSPGGHAIDVHEARQNLYGTRAVEVYNNLLINTTYTDSSPIIKGVGKSPSGGYLEPVGIAIRSGEALVYNNQLKGYACAVSLSNWYYGGTEQPYPMPYSPGYLSGKMLGDTHTGTGAAESRGDVFIWNNTNDPFLEDKNDTAALFKNSQPDWWKEGRDYHFEAKPGYHPFPYPYPVSSKNHYEGSKIILKLN